VVAVVGLGLLAPELERWVRGSGVSL